MKNLIFLFTATAILTLTSCSEDAPNFVGVFEITKQDFQCPSQTFSFDAGSNGICIPSDDRETCIYWKYDIRLDGTYTESRISTNILGGIMFSSPSSGDGTYTTIDNEISLTNENGSVTKLQIDELETELSGFIGEPTSEGCRLFSILSKI